MSARITISKEDLEQLLDLPEDVSLAPEYHVMRAGEDGFIFHVDGIDGVYTARYGEATDEGILSLVALDPIEHPCQG